MADVKKIKFNLRCDGKSIRSIEELRDNFSIEDVLEHFKNGLLGRWLEVRGYSDEMEAVSKLYENKEHTKDIEIATELVKIFFKDDKQELTDSEINEALYNLEVEEEKQKKFKAYSSNKAKRENRISEEIKDYTGKISEILNDPTNEIVVKKNIKELVTTYKYFFMADYRRLFYELCTMAPLAIIYLLTHKMPRKLYLTGESTDAADYGASEAETEAWDIEWDEEWYEEWDEMGDERWIDKKEEDQKEISKECYNIAECIVSHVYTDGSTLPIPPILTKRADENKFINSEWQFICDKPCMIINAGRSTGSQPRNGYVREYDRGDTDVPCITNWSLEKVQKEGWHEIYKIFPHGVEWKAPQLDATIYYILLDEDEEREVKDEK